MSREDMQQQVRDQMARAMRAQGKVDPAEVFEASADVDLDEPTVPVPPLEQDPGPESRPVDHVQAALLDDERGYTYEP